MRYLLIANDRPLTPVMDMPKLKMVLSGVQRMLSLTRSPHTRLTITPPLLRQLRTIWSQQAYSYEHIMLWAVFCVCFFGFFRLEELIPVSETAYDASRHVQLSDLTSDCPHNPTRLSIHLKRAKTDQLGRGATVYICRSDSDLCLVTVLLAFVAARGQQPDPLFRWVDGSPLSKPWVILKIREALTAIGVDPALYAGHSFRIGAATTAATAGIEDSIIQALGRWFSSAFLSYIRLTPQELAALSSRMNAASIQEQP